MTTLAIGSSVTLSVGDGGSFNLSTGGGLASVTVTPTVGAVSVVNLGALAERRMIGPFAEGASVVVANISCASLDYDYSAAGVLTAAQVVATQALVSGAVFITAGVAAASANSTAINAALTAVRVAGGGTVTVIGSGVCYHDRTITPGSYTKFVTVGCVLRLAPGASCNQVRNYGAQNAINRTYFISVAAGFMTVIEKGHNREVGNQVYIENCQGNTTPNGVQTITESGTNVSGFRYWKVAVASNAAITNDIYTAVFVSNYMPLAGSAFNRTAVSATATISIAAPGVVTVTGHLLSRSDPVYFTTTGALPTGLSANTTYYVLAVLSANTLTLSATKRGAAIITTGTQSGTHTLVSSGTVVVTEPNHRKQFGDSVYIAGIPVGSNSFNGSILVNAVVKGVSWSYRQLGATEVGSGTAQTQTDTGMIWDIASLDYDSANNVFDELWAVNVMIGNAANSEFVCHQLSDGWSRAFHFFNGGRGVRIPKIISSSQSGVNSKGTFQIESFAGDLEIGYCEQNGSTDDCLAWGITTSVSPFGATASPSGAVDLGSLHVGRCFITSNGTGGALKVFSTADNYDLGFIKVDNLDGAAGGVVLQDLSPSGCTIKSVHLGLVSNTAQAVADQMLVTGWKRIDLLRIDTFVETQQISTRVAMKFGATTIGHLHIGTLSLQQNRAAEIGVQFGTGSVMENVSIDTLVVACQAGYEAFRIQGTCVVQNISLGKTRYICASTYSGDLFSCNSGGTIQALNISDFKGNGRSLYTAGGSGSATAVKIKLTDVECPSIANDGGTSQAGTVLFSNVEQSGGAVNMFSTSGSGTWKIKGKNFVHFAGVVAYLAGGGASISIDCPDAQIDLGANAGAPPARLIPLAGNQLWNTNATGTGLYGYTAAGAWVKLF